MIFTDSKVVVVGGSSGIGLGVAEAALAEGAAVVIAGRSAAKLEAATKAMGKPARLTAIAVDVTDEDSIRQLFDRVGSFDHLVVTRGVVPVGAPVAELDIGAVRSFVDTMLVSAFTLAKHGKGGIAGDGSITFTSGISKDKPGVPGGAVVAAVAGSFDYMVRALALELAPVRVNVVSPGWVKTPMWEEIAGPAKDAMWADMAARLPVGRIATPADIAATYLHVMGSAFTTGTTVHVDGGHALL